jgi:death-on-curing protein
VRYLTVGDVIAFNRAEVGGDALADFGLLESAVLRPQTAIGELDAYPSVHEKAAALMHSLIRNHPFVDGNKRTAVVATFT